MMILFWVFREMGAYVPPTCHGVGRSDSFGLLGQLLLGQVKAARIVCQASAMASAYFQVWSIRTRV
jgi:hypothetical protein